MTLLIINSKPSSFFFFFDGNETLKLKPIIPILMFYKYRLVTSAVPQCTSLSTNLEFDYVTFLLIPIF